MRTFNCKATVFKTGNYKTPYMGEISISYIVKKGDGTKREVTFGKSVRLANNREELEFAMRKIEANDEVLCRVRLGQGFQFQNHPTYENSMDRSDLLNKTVVFQFIWDAPDLAILVNAHYS